MSVTIPMIHLNGTSAKSLEGEIREVVDAIGVLRRALQNMTVNGRDHYPKADKESFNKARAEHVARFEVVDKLEAELTELYLGIRDQV
jgi:hypothetical protein